VYATAPASVSLTSGDTSSTFSVNAGITKLRVLSRPGPIVGTLSRLGITKIQVNPGSAFSYTAAPVVYNYNAFVVAGHGTAL
jgi:glucan endo-1,3-alpha-glucosidase